MRIQAFLVQVALAIVGRDHATQFAVARVMEASIGGEEQQTAGLLTPSDLFAAHDCLHHRIEATFRCIQIARHVRILNLFSETIGIAA
uniref:Putative secreted protein n=1 Tax=Anopheles triannulatus TaxID=58253 RepID=A0A2M4B3V8_9DIPT